MARILNWLGFAAAALAVMALALFVLANTQAGQNAIGPLVSPLTGGKVSIRGLSGRFPGALHAREVVISDRSGPWLIIDNATVDGSILSLVANHIDIQRLVATHVQVLRLPVSANDNQSMPRIDIVALDLPDLETGAAVSAMPMRFAAHGSLHIQSRDDVAADLTLNRLDGPGTYRADGSIGNGIANGNILVNEGTKGFITGLLRLNDIGPIRGNLRAEGSANANRIVFAMDAGMLHAAGNGTISIAAQSVDLDFSASAPAMKLRPDLSWQSFAAEGHAHGILEALTLDSRLEIAGLKARGISITMLSGRAAGAAGAADFTADASGLEMNGMDPKFFAGAPVSLRAHADLRAAGRPVAFTLTHPLVKATGTARLEGIAVDAKIAIPALRPIARLAGINVDGRTDFAARYVLASNSIALDGTIATTGGDAMISGLVGRNARFTFSANVDGPVIGNIRAGLRGAQADAQMNGAIHNGSLDLAISAGIADVSRIIPDLKGSAAIRATIKGPIDTARVAANVAGTIGARNLEPQRVGLDIEGSVFQKDPSGTFRGQTTYRSAPVLLSGTFGWSAHELRFGIQRGEWKSLTLSGEVTIPQGAPFTANATLHMAQLADLAPFIGMQIAGNLDGSVKLQRHGETADLAVQATAHAVSLGNASLTMLTVAGDIADPFAQPRLSLKLGGSGISANGFSGAATADLGGTLDALAVNTTGDLNDSAGRPAKIAATATLRRNSEEIALHTLSVDYRDLRAGLARPATISLAKGLSVDRLDLRSGDAQLSVSGRLTPELAADVALDNLSAKPLQQLFPGLVQATLSGTAQLTGTIDAPRGTASIRGRGLRIQGLSTSIAPGSLDARLDLAGRSMQVDATLVFGPSKFTINGRVPLATDAPINLHAAGETDLSLLNIELTAVGRRVLGQAALDAAVSGTLNAPSITGSMKVTNAEFQDYTSGLRLTEVAGNAQFKGRTIDIVDFTGRAGAGTIKGSGTIDLAAPGMPVSMVIVARNAEPVASDAFHATLDADLKITGSIAKRIEIGGKITVLRAESILPNSFPPAVTTLNVTRTAQTASAPVDATSPDRTGLNLDITSPGLFFVRGRGLDAELEGNLHLGGTISTPLVTGAFTLRRGTFDLGGSTLDFRTGKVTFDNVSLRNRIDPALDFSADTTVGGYTASLEITGTVSNPKVQLTSTPAMPQDEILSQLLFQQNVKQLTPLQLAGLAQAAAALGGFGNGLNPLASVRRTLGLDRLSVISGANNQTELEAGKYVSRSVYVGAKQGLTNSPQAEVQIDLTKNLKAKANIATGTTATVTQGAQQQDSGSSIGLSWQFEY